MADCIVIGGGVIGLLTARALHLAGLEVVLVERGKLGGESSWAGGGIISPLYPWRYAEAVNQLAEKSKNIYPELAAQLQAESGVDCELLSSGMLYTDVDEFEAASDWAEKCQQRLELITDRQSLLQIEPALHPDIERAIWLPDIRQIRNPMLVQALRGSLQSLGLRCIEHTEVDEILHTAGKISGVRTGQQVIHADRVVVASGAWSARVMQGLGDIDIEPVKGQMLMFRGEPGQIQTMVLSHGHYIIPRRDGRVLAGSTLEKTGFEKQITGDAMETLSADAAALIPLLAELPIERQWAGLRPGTLNGIPYICTHPEIDGLYIHAGHYRNGIVLGPASAQLLTEIVLAGDTFCDASAYAMSAAH
jgi:glycine oxidase